MNFSNITELKDYLRRYNSHSILKMGASICWREWESWKSSPYEWVKSNASRNYVIRLILLASAGNIHRDQEIIPEEFYSLIQVYFGWPNHTISDKNLLEKESEEIVNNIAKYEKNHINKVRNWTIKPSDFITKEKVRRHSSGLFCQRSAAFQNSGFGKPIARIQRTIKLLEIIHQSHPLILELFYQRAGLSTQVYFNQFMSAIGWGMSNGEQWGLIDFSRTISIDKELEDQGITQENLEKFISLNSLPFNLSTKKGSQCFWTKVERSIETVSEPYQPFFYNYFLDIPFIYLGKQKYCLPDPFSLSESCWNQINTNILTPYEENRKKRDGILSDAVETYLEAVFLPQIAPTSFERIPVDETDSINKAGKRADFLICLPNAYIIIECKNSLMSADTSACFHPEGLANFYMRFHEATEQISATVRAYNLKDKPVIPLVLSFYDAIRPSQMFEFMIEETNYCSELSLTMPPVIHSLHEFEHFTENRSLENWAELRICQAKQPRFVPPDERGQPQPPPVPRDNRGHEYKHLADYKSWLF